MDLKNSHLHHATDELTTRSNFHISMTLGFRLLLSLCIQCGLAFAALSQEHRTVHFYTGSGDIRWDLLTHLILFDKSNLDANGGFIPPSASEAANIVRLRREAMVHGKTLIYGMAGGFSSYQPMLADAAKRAAYIDGAAKMIGDHELAGVDFDFEYPVTSADFALMDTFFNAMRARLGPKPLITASVAHWQVQMNSNTINNSLDWVQTMGYYFRSAAQSASDLARYTDAGATPARLCLGVPFAGKSQNSPTIPWDIGYNSLVGKVTPFDPAVNSVFHVDGDFQFVGVNFQKEKLRVAADGGGGTMVWHHTVDVTDSARSVAVSLHEESVRYVAPIDGFELPAGVSANAIYQNGGAAIQGSHTRVNGLTGGEVTFSFNGSLYSQSRVRSKDAATPFGFPSGASIRLDYKIIDAAANVHFYLRLRDSAGNYIQAPAYDVFASTGWKRLTFGRSSFSANASFNENDIRSYELFGQYGAIGSAFTSRVVLDNLVMISPHPALRPVPDADADGFSDLLEHHLGTSAVNPATTPTAGFAGMHAWWRLDEAAYPVCADAVRGIHGMASGGTRVAGKSGNALQLDGVDDRILMAPAASLVGAGSFTLSAWVKTNDADGGVILQQRDASTNGYQGQYQLGMTPQGTVSFFIYNGGFQFDFATTASIRDGQWHHVAAVREGTEGRIFIDGVLAGQASGAVKSLEPLAVTAGCDYRDNISFLNAALDDIRIYRRALDAQDLADVSAYTPALLADRSVSYDDRLPVGSTITTLASQGALPGSSTVYRIVAGDPTEQFQLDTSTGVLSLSRYPDATTSGSQVLTVEAVTDGLSSSRSLANITLNLVLFTKQDNTDALNLGSSWVGGTAPGADHVALWNRTLAAASSVALGADRSWHGLRIADPGGLVTIPTGNTLTLGASGIDMAAATQDLTIEAGLLSGASQSWNVASGRTFLRPGGTTTFGTGTTTTLSGTGTVGFGGTQDLSGSGALVIDGCTLLNNLQGGTMDRSGSTLLNSGTIKLQSPANLFGNGTLHLNGGAIGSGNATAFTVGCGLAIGGDPAIGGNGLGTGLLTFMGNTDLNGGNRTLTSNLTSGLGAHFSGIVSNGGLVKAGAGILTLSGANTFSGPTSVDAGGLAIGLNGLSNSSTVVLSGISPQLFIGANGTTTLNNLSGVASATIRSDLTITGTAGARTLAIHQTTNGTYAGTFVEGGGRPISLTKTGTATLALSNTGNNFTGNIQVDAGQLDAGATQSGSVTGPLGAVIGGRTLTINSGATVRFLPNNVFGGSGKSAATIPNVVVNGGTLQIYRFNILGNVTLNSGTLRNSNGPDPVTYDGFQFIGPVTVGGSSASTLETTTGKGGHLLGAGTNVFTVNDATGDSAPDFIVNTILRNGSGDYPGAGTLVKSGPGTMLLAGHNVYTGTTTVNNGTLLVNGSLGSGAVTVTTGATLGGNGNLGGSLTIQSGGIHALTVAAAPSAQVTRTISGSLDLNAGNVLTLTSNTPPQPGIFILATATGGITGTPGTVNLPPGVKGSVTVNENSLALIVRSDYTNWLSTFTFAPEADTSPTGDPDRDGLVNFNEYAFGLVPDSGTSASPVTTLPSRSHGTFSYTRRSVALSNLTFTYEWSDTLTGAWTSFSPVLETSNFASPVETITVGLTPALIGKPALFVRVKATN